MISKKRKVAVPPIKCQGIKTKLVDWILDHVALEDNGKWIEPFMGSGVVGFNVRPQQALFNDINPHIVNFYNSVKKSEITAGKAKVFLEKEGDILRKHGQEHYYSIRERFNSSGNSLDLLFLNRSSFNGVMRFNKNGKYNVPFGHKPNRFSQAYVTKIINQIKYVSQATEMYNWEFTCLDFRQIIQGATKKDFVYCDPPYIGRHTDYFNSWSEDDEQDLYELLASTKAKFILSTWHSNKYRTNAALEKYAKDFIVFTREHFYHVGAKEKNRNPMLEAIVLNYDPEPQEIPIDLEQLALFEKKNAYDIHKILTGDN